VIETFHSRHHRLYVPYAFGALYNHPFEGLLMDTIGAGLGYKLSGMGPREGMVFFSFSTMKTVDDHCGYALPWDPLQKIFWNNAGYHDVHHQSWGIKVRCFFLHSLRRGD
jgi:sphinganine C4-monooxygenase